MAIYVNVREKDRLTNEQIYETVADLRAEQMEMFAREYLKLPRGMLNDLAEWQMERSNYWRYNKALETFCKRDDANDINKLAELLRKAVKRGLMNGDVVKKLDNCKKRSGRLDGVILSHIAKKVRSSHGNEFIRLLGVEPNDIDIVMEAHPSCETITQWKYMFIKTWSVMHEGNVTYGKLMCLISDFKKDYCRQSNCSDSTSSSTESGTRSESPGITREESTNAIILNIPTEDIMVFARYYMKLPKHELENLDGHLKNTIRNAVYHSLVLWSEKNNIRKLKEIVRKAIDKDMVKEGALEIIDNYLKEKGKMDNGLLSEIACEIYADAARRFFALLKIEEDEIQNMLPYHGSDKSSVQMKLSLVEKWKSLNEDATAEKLINLIKQYQREKDDDGYKNTGARPKVPPKPPPQDLYYDYNDHYVNGTFNADVPVTDDEIYVINSLLPRPQFEKFVREKLNIHLNDSVWSEYLTIATYDRVYRAIEIWLERHRETAASQKLQKVIAKAIKEELISSSAGMLAKECRNIKEDPCTVSKIAQQVSVPKADDFIKVLKLDPEKIDVMAPRRKLCEADIKYRVVDRWRRRNDAPSRERLKELAREYIPDNSKDSATYCEIYTEAAKREEALYENSLRASDVYEYVTVDPFNTTNKDDSDEFLYATCEGYEMSNPQERRTASAPNGVPSRQQQRPDSSTLTANTKMIQELARKMAPKS